MKKVVSFASIHTLKPLGTVHDLMFLNVFFALVAHVLIQLQLLHETGFMPTHRSKSLVRHSLNQSHTNCSVRARAISGFDICQCQAFKPEHGWIPPFWTEESWVFKYVRYTIAFDSNRILSRLPAFYAKLSERHRLHFLKFLRIIVPWYQKNTVDARIERIDRSTNILSRIPVRDIPFDVEWWNKLLKKYGWKKIKQWVTMVGHPQMSVVKNCTLHDESSAKKQMPAFKSRKRRKMAIRYGQRRSFKAFQRFQESMAIADLRFTGSGYVLSFLLPLFLMWCPCRRNYTKRRRLGNRLRAKFSKRGRCLIPRLPSLRFARTATCL